jgi:hypothetical protein
MMGPGRRIEAPRNGREGLAVTKAMDSVVENLKSLRPAIEVEVAAIGRNWKWAVCIVETRRYSTQDVERGPGTALGKGHGSHRGRVRTKSAAMPVAEAVKTTFLIVKEF